MDDLDVSTPGELPVEPVVAARLRRLATKFAAAAGDEARARRKLERAMANGSRTDELVAGLDHAATRVVEIARRIEDLVASGDPSDPEVRPVVGPDARTRSDDDPPPPPEPAPSSPRSRRSALAEWRGAGRGGPSAATVAAAIDVGSNSVHLLVAVVRGHRLQPLVDVSEFLGLGVAVDREGRIGDGLARQLVETIGEYVRDAKTLGAGRVTIVATDPLRRAADGAAVAAAIRTATGVEVAVVEHDEEALLTLLGVTAGRPVVRDLVLVDIGGGSSEVLSVAPAGALEAVGLPIGSARLTALFADHDPPSAAELDAMLTSARAVVAGAPDARPREVIIVGGTSSNLLRVVPAAALDRTITRRRLAEAIAVLASETAVDAAARHGIRESRARVMPAGAAIVAAILERYGIERIHVSEAGIREGALLATVHAGAEWRRHLEWLAHGWSRSPATERVPEEHDA